MIIRSDVLSILQESLLFFKKPAGGWVLAFNVVYALLLGLFVLLGHVLIIGPATLILKEQQIFMWIVLPFLSLIFLVLIGALTIAVQFFIFVILYREIHHEKPLWSLAVFEKEGNRLKLYVEAVVRAALEVIVGLIFLIVPGVMIFSKYLLIGPIAVFEHARAASVQSILTRSKNMTAGYQSSLLVLVGVALVSYMVSYWIFGDIFSRLIVLPVLFGFSAVFLVHLYEHLNTGANDRT